MRSEHNQGGDAPYLLQQAAGRSAEHLLQDEIASILGRALRRTDRAVPYVLTESLACELKGTPLRDLIRWGLEPLSSKQTDEEALRSLVGQEAGFFYNAAPLGYGEGEHFVLDVGLDSNALTKMETARMDFYARYAELRSVCQAAWAALPPPTALQELSFGDTQAVVEVSLCVPCMSRRVREFAARLPALSDAYCGGRVELVLTIADACQLGNASLEVLTRAAQRATFPVRVICNSGTNRIGMNRTLALRRSRGRYCVFLDDDVRMVGAVLDSLIVALTQYPQLGLVSIPSYDVLYSKSPRWHKPRWHNLKVRLLDGSGLMLVNLVPGMIMATRREIALVASFPTFWPNTGEDYFFSEEVNRLGFLNAYIFPEGAWVEHESITHQSDVSSSSTFADMLCSSCLAYYLAPRNFEPLREGLYIAWLQKYFPEPISFEATRALWHSFREQAVKFLDGEGDALTVWADSAHSNNLWLTKRPQDIQAIIRHLELECGAITEFKRNEFHRKDLAQLDNSFLGPLRYTVAATEPKAS